MQFGSGLAGKLFALALLAAVGLGMTAPAEASILDWFNWQNWFPTRPVSVPEPATLALFATGAAAVGLMRRRRKKD